MKKPAGFIVWVFFLMLISSPVFPQTFDDFKNQIREEYDEFEKETQKKFDNFVTKIDKEFADYLVNGFKNHNVEKKTTIPVAPKPNTIPDNDEIEVSGNIINYKVGYIPTTYQGPAYPGIKKSDATNTDIRNISIEFLGWPLQVDLDSRFFAITTGKPSAENIGLLWSTLASLDYNNFLYQLSEISNTLNLNQWGYYQLIKTCSEKVYPSDNNMQIVFQWALLSRSRYKVKIGFNNQNMYLLIPSIYRMYNIDYINLAGTNYYVMDGKGNQIQTYEKDFPEADILMDVCIKKPFNTNPIKKSRDYHFTFKGKKHTVNLEYDEEMINFYKSIPLSDIIIYFNSVVSERTKKSILQAFEPLLKDKDNVESVNFLLSFMQQSFGYKTDQYAYGTERYFFADEVLHYNFSDCEDRSVLLSYLIKTLLKKEVVAVGLPGHMAIAIDLNENVGGSHFKFNNKTFVLADPTFTGAPVGVLMSTVADKEATIYKLDNNYLNSDKAESIWQITNEYGGFKSDRLVDVVQDDQGNYYICGYFNGLADFGIQKLVSTNEGRDIFIAKYNSHLNPLWVRSVVGQGNDMAMSIAIGSNNNVYVYGSFESDLNFDKMSLKANNAPDVFVACYSKGGKFNWARKAGIDKLDHSLDFMFVAKFNPLGDKIMAKLYSQSEDFDHYGLDIDEDDNAVIVGSFFATSGMNTNDYTNYNIGNDLNIPVTLYETDVKLKQNEYEATIAGLFSALNLLKANSIEIHGSEIKTTFDTYNNKFNTYASGIYENLGKMMFVKNEKGIVTIKTSSGKPIKLDKIKIANNAKIRIVKYKSGNILVEVLSGIYVGGGNRWLDMNSIKLFKNTGDLLFNFDVDNTVKKLNLKKELLKKS